MSEFAGRTRAPNVASEAVKEFREGLQNEQQGANDVSTESAPSQQQEVKMVPPSQMPPLPDEVYRHPQPTQAQPQPDYQTVLSQYQANMQAMQQHIAQLTSELDEARKLPDEYQRMRDDQELDKLLAQQEFSSLDTEDAKRLISPLIQSIRKQNEQSEKRVQQYAQAVNQRFDEMAKHEAASRITRTRDKVLKAHPDLEALQQTEAYRKLMLTPLGGNSGILTGQLVAAEFNNGNADYVINVLNQVKQAAAPDLMNMVSVGSGSSAVQPAPQDNSGGAMTPEQLAEARYKRQIGELSANQFRYLMKKHRESKGK